jgi:hypothetical protein
LPSNFLFSILFVYRSCFSAFFYQWKMAFCRRKQYS